MCIVRDHSFASRAKYALIARAKSAATTEISTVSEVECLTIHAVE